MQHGVIAKASRESWLERGLTGLESFLHEEMLTIMTVIAHWDSKGED